MIRGQSSQEASQYRSQDYHSKSLCLVKKDTEKRFGMPKTDVVGIRHPRYQRYYGTECRENADSCVLTFAACIQGVPNPSLPQQISMLKKRILAHGTGTGIFDSMRIQLNPLCRHRDPRTTSASYVSEGFKRKWLAVIATLHHNDAYRQRVIDFTTNVENEFHTWLVEQTR